jgi:hypothetical protein
LLRCSKYPERHKRKERKETMFITPHPTEDEAAAAIAAVSWYLAEEAAQTQDTGEAEWRWQASATMVEQSIHPVRAPQKPTWGNIERLRRAGRGDTGIIGL